MGIIIKQSIRGSIWSYLGLVAGYINVGLIMPNILGKEEVGLIQILAASSLIFAQLSTLGFTGVISRMFPLFRNSKTNHNGFLFLTLAVALLGFAVSFNAFQILKPNIIESNLSKSPLLVEYIYLFIPLMFFRMFFLLLDSYNKMLYDAVTGTFWMEFGHRIMNLLLIGLVAFGWINFRQFIFGYVFSLCFPVLPLIWVLIRRKEFGLKPKLSFLKKPLVKEMGIVSFFGFINGFDGIFISNIDKIFVGQYLSLEEVGIFSVCALFATLILIPFRAISKISTGIIADSWKSGNVKHIQEVYLKSSINQLVIGSLLFVGIWINLDNIFKILPADYSSGKSVVIIYALGMLINSSSGVSAPIISTSKKYKFGTLILLSSIISLIIFSMVLIPKYGIVGAAMASALTYSLRALFRVIFLKWHYNMFCYDKNTVLIFLISALSIFVGKIIPTLDFFIYDILLKSTSVTLLYSILIYKLGISSEVNDLWNKLYKEISKKLPFISAKK